MADGRLLTFTPRIVTATPRQALSLRGSPSVSAHVGTNNITNGSTNSGTNVSTNAGTNTVANGGTEARTSAPIGVASAAARSEQYDDDLERQIYMATAAFDTMLPKDTTVAIKPVQPVQPAQVQPAPAARSEIDLTAMISMPMPQERKEQRRAPAPHYTREEITGLLVGYFRVPHDQWVDILPGAMVRYFRKGGGGDKSARFSIGGIVEEGREGMLTISGNSVPLSDIDDIWKLRGQGVMIELNILYSEIQSLRDELRELKKGASY